MNAKPIPPERRVLAEVIICSDSTCRENLPVSKDALQTAWRTSGAWRSVGLMFSECTGMCSTGPNIFIITREQTTLLNNVSQPEAITALIGWAQQTHEKQRIQPLPHALQSHSASFFRE